MPPVKKLENRTLRFIEHYNRLNAEKKLPANVDLANILGIKSKSTISEIIAKRQNIQPDSWDKFKSYFGITDTEESTEKSVPRESFKSVGKEVNITLDMLSDLIKSNAALAESNKSLARSHEELVTLVKATGGSEKQTSTSVLSTLMGLREYVIDMGSRFYRVSVSEAESALGTKVVEAHKRLDKEDIPVDESK